MNFSFRLQQLSSSAEFMLRLRAFDRQIKQFQGFADLSTDGALTDSQADRNNRFLTLPEVEIEAGELVERKQRRVDQLVSSSWTCPDTVVPGKHSAVGPDLVNDLHAADRLPQEESEHAHVQAHMGFTRNDVAALHQRR